MALERDSFYMFLSSDSSEAVFPDNVKSSFSVQLAKPVHLDPSTRWGVGLAEILIDPGIGAASARSAGVGQSRAAGGTGQSRAAGGAGQGGTAAGAAGGAGQGSAGQQSPGQAVAAGGAGQSPAGAGGGAAPAAGSGTTFTVWGTKTSDSVHVKLDERNGLEIPKALNYTVEDFGERNMEVHPRMARAIIHKAFQDAIEEEEGRTDLVRAPPNPSQPATLAFFFKNKYATATEKSFDSVGAFLHHIGTHMDGRSAYLAFLNDLALYVQAAILVDVANPTRARRQAGSMAGPIFCYVNVAEPVRLSDTFSKVIRIIPDGADHYTFDSVYYVPVQTYNFATISIFLANKLGERYPFRDGSRPTIMTLHFKNMGGEHI